MPGLKRRQHAGITIQQGITRHWYGIIEDTTVCLQKWGGLWYSHHGTPTGGRIARAPTLAECVEATLEQLRHDAQA